MTSSLPNRAAAWRWLLTKEWRELLASRAWWVLVALAGPLVGVSFGNAVRAYAEVSAGAGNACGIVCAPLIGIWAPTFSAYEIAAIFLLPFVAIRAVSGDAHSGALTLEIQRPLSPLARVAARAAVLVAGWMIAGLAALVAMALWASYGGSTYLPEVGVVALGHLLNGTLTIALALAIGSVADNPSTAAIVTLAATIGTWVIAFAAALQGGVWTTIADYTPTAMVSMFQHALVQTNVLLATLVAIAAAFVVSAIWLRLYDTAARRWARTAATLVVAAGLAAGAAHVRGSWDASESRYNSFDEADEEALARLPAPLAIEAHLAPQDPRRTALERGPFAKLRRVVPSMRVTYVARTGTGMYEESDPGYGEVRYTYEGRTASSREVSDEGVLETIFDLAHLAPGGEEEEGFRGHPLVATAKGAAVLFYVVWPAVVVGLAILVGRRRR
ncbi:MAG TPA: hypothetical protein VFX12_11125 [Vicinamibacterales bacterium]|nr:hypothetical protein [Vicinamibacterales bacterium]